MANKKSRLHIPQPTARPGDKPDFSYLDLSDAGAIDKPSINARTRDIEYLSSGLVRVLDDKHHAVGPWNPDLDPAKRYAVICEGGWRSSQLASWMRREGFGEVVNVIDGMAGYRD